MERLFEPKTEQEAELVKIIKTHSDKDTRKKALKELLVLNGFDKKELYAIRSKETYDRIPNKPSTWMRFRMASIVYNDTMLKR